MAKMKKDLLVKNPFLNKVKVVTGLAGSASARNRIKLSLPDVDVTNFPSLEHDKCITLEFYFWKRFIYLESQSYTERRRHRATKR